MRYLIYTRVSERGSDWAGETSCGAQAEECRRFMARAHPGGVEVGVIEDEFVTGTNNSRPGLKRIIELCRSGKPGWETLVVLDIDRLVRSMEGYVDLLRELQVAGCALVAIRQDVDMTSPSGRFLMHMLVASAEFFAGQNASKTRDKMLWIARQGLWPAGNAPMGYRRDGSKNNKLSVDTEKASKVVAIFSDAAQGVQITELCRRHRLPRNTMIKVLRNSTVIGRLVYGGVDVPGQHDAIVDKETWARVQALHAVKPIKEKHARPTRQQHPYLLTGLVRCSCGRAMSPATCKGRHGGKYPYYRCVDTVECKQRAYVRADLLEAEVQRQFAAIRYDVATQEAVAAILAERVARYHAEASQAVAAATAGLRDARGKRQRLLDAIGSGQISGAALADVNGVLAETITAIRSWENVLEENSRNRPVWNAQKVAMSLERLLGEKNSATSDPRLLAAWMRAHVKTISPREDGAWLMVFELPEGSTSSAQWHPVGALVEIVFRLKKVA